MTVILTVQRDGQLATEPNHLKCSSVHCAGQKYMTCHKVVNLFQRVWTCIWTDRSETSPICRQFFLMHVRSLRRKKDLIKDWRLRTSCIKPEIWPPIAMMMQVPQKTMIIFNSKPVPNRKGFSISCQLGRDGYWKKYRMSGRLRVPVGHCSKPSWN